MNVLIVSEVGMFRHYMQRLVQQEGHDTRGVSNVGEFFDFLRSGRRIDLIITDWMFSGSTARELVAAAKKVTRLDDFGNAASVDVDYIILVTPRSDQDDRDYRRMLDSISLLGIGEVIEKPFDRLRIQDAIRVVASKRAARSMPGAERIARTERETQSIAERPDTKVDTPSVVDDKPETRPPSVESSLPPDLLRGMLQHVPVGILLINPSGLIVDCNSALCRIFGFTEAELRGQNVSRLIPSPHSELHDGYLAAFLQSGRSRVVGALRELIGRSRDGRLVPIELRVETIACGTENYFVGVINDISHRVELERSRSQMLDSVAAQNLELQRLSHDADAANQAKSRFLANISHEIRTPMTAIIGYSEMLLEGLIAPEEQREALKTICQSSEHLLGLVNNILDLSKIENGLTTIQRSRIELQPFIAETLASLRPHALKKGLYLNLDHPSDLPPHISTDPTRLRQILMNLVDNAIKFTERGGVSVSLQSVKSFNGRTQIEISVRDTGSGISNDRLANLFRPFSRSEGASHQFTAGAGLGLAISRECARILGGDIAVQSVPGQGSTFVATIEIEPAPLTGDVDAQDSQPTEGRDAVQSTAPETNPLSGLRILLAEDGEVNQRLISTMLRKSGAEVVHAPNGKVAISQVMEADRNGLAFDVVLMDMQMPVMDGYEAVRHLRQSGCATPVVALTALAMSNDRDRCLSAGCSDFLSKPVDRNKLIGVVLSNVLRSGRSQSPKPLLTARQAPVLAGSAIQNGMSR